MSIGEWVNIWLAKYIVEIVIFIALIAATLIAYGINQVVKKWKARK